MLDVQSIVDVGFPVAITVYLLYERNRLNVKIVESLKEITVTLKNVNDHIVGRF